MTESEWAASDEPAAMLEHLARWPTGDPSGGRAAHRRLPSDRKLRLWVEACRAYSSASDYVDDLGSCSGLQVALEYWGSRDGTSVPQAARAHLLRDIVGNPHRPVSLLPGKRVACRRCDGLGRVPPRITTACPACKGAGGRAEPCPWLTPTVVSLAHAAYDSRDPQTGHLDPLTLAAVADALEEAGCDSEPLLAHLRDRPCPCSFRHLPHDSCDGSAFRAKVHVRGCWAIDLLTGRE